MKTLEQIKNEFAISKGLADWEDVVDGFKCEYLSFSKFSEYIDQVMKIYAMECLKLASENAYTKDVRFTDDVEVDKESITNENNIIK